MKEVAFSYKSEKDVFHFSLKLEIFPMYKPEKVLPILSNIQLKLPQENVINLNLFFSKEIFYQISILEKL